MYDRSCVSRSVADPVYRGVRIRIVANSGEKRIECRRGSGS